MRFLLAFFTCSGLVLGESSLVEWQRYRELKSRIEALEELVEPHLCWSSNSLKAIKESRFSHFRKVKMTRDSVEQVVKAMSEIMSDIQRGLQNMDINREEMLVILRDKKEYHSWYKILIVDERKIHEAVEYSTEIRDGLDSFTWRLIGLDFDSIVEECFEKD